MSTFSSAARYWVLLYFVQIVTVSVGLSISKFWFHVLVQIAGIAPGPLRTGGHNKSYWEPESLFGHIHRLLRICGGSFTSMESPGIPSVATSAT